MPIRTNRGRAAVYRRLWSWMLTSPARLLVLPAALLAAGVALAMIPAPSAPAPARLSAPSASPPGSGTLPSSAAAGSATSASAPGPTGSSSTATSTPGSTVPPEAPPQALAAATDFARSWVQHPPGTTTHTWIKGLEPYAMPELLVLLRDVDPARIAATAVTGAPRATRVSQGLVEVEIDTDRQALSLSLVPHGSQWRVTRYEQVEKPR